MVCSYILICPVALLHFMFSVYLYQHQRQPVASSATFVPHLPFLFFKIHLNLSTFPHNILKLSSLVMINCKSIKYSSNGTLKTYNHQKQVLIRYVILRNILHSAPDRWIKVKMVSVF